MAKRKQDDPLCLNPKQLRFVDEYMLTGNQMQAARAVGYKENYGRDLVRNPKIAGEIIKRRQQRSERTGIDADWLLTRLAEEANADIKDLFDPDTLDLLHPTDWPEVWRRGLATTMDITKLKHRNKDNDPKNLVSVTRLKIQDRTGRLKMIGEHVNVGAFKPEDKAAMQNTQINIIITELDKNI